MLLVTCGSGLELESVESAANRQEPPAPEIFMNPTPVIGDAAVSAAGPSSSGQYALTAVPRSGAATKRRSVDCSGSSRWRIRRSTPAISHVAWAPAATPCPGHV